MLYVMEIARQKLRIVFSSVLENIPEVIEDAVEFLNGKGYKYESFSLKLAIAEGLTNAVKHGNGFNPRLNAVFTLDIASGNLVMTFEDQGDGFDWQNALKKEMPGERQVSGRGIVLLQAYGYMVKYNHAGNKLCLIKTS